MVRYKVYLTLAALITCHVNANYEYKRLKDSSQLADTSQNPWNRQYDIYEAASSKTSPYYSDGSSKDRFKELLGSPSERFLSGNIKKGPSENKSLKKPLVLSFYAPLGNKELLRSGHCQEIKVKPNGKENDSRENVVTCYRCKNPNNKSMYERCFYNSQSQSKPESVSAGIKVKRHLPGNFRYRRSNEKYESDYGKPRNPYRFTEEYFTDATYDAPSTHEKDGEKCEKIVKDSMVCIVCKDAKTNGKYEQCSYVKQPREKAYSYIKSSSRGKPQEQEEEDDDVQRPTEISSYSRPSDIHEFNSPKHHNRTAENDDAREYSHFGELHPQERNRQDEAQDTPSADCKQVQKDSKSCTICKDSKTGGTYEKCSYSYQPSDKLYKYRRSKSFGHPRKSSDSARRSSKITQASDKSKHLGYPQDSESTREDAYFDKSKRPPYPRRSDETAESEVADDSDDVSHVTSDYSNGYSNPERSDYYAPVSSDDNSESYETATSSDRAESTPESYIADINKNHCKKFQKDSMTCTVCRDPKTGNDFERCSYSYEPSDKLFSYSKSNSFNSSKEKDRAHVPRENERPDSSDTVKVPYEYTSEIYEASTADEVQSEDDAKEKTEVTPGYSHTAEKKAEIEGFLRNFQKKDRSKCKKIIRDKMTCYQCVDEEGSQKEECVFIAGQEPDKKQLAFHEVKEFQIGSASRVNRLKLPKPTKTRKADPLEPAMSTSKNSYLKLEKPDNDYPDEARRTAEETKETEPYDYTSETRSRYDKVLGLTLPQYMLATSEHEAAFDEIVASDYEQR